MPRKLVYPKWFDQTPVTVNVTQGTNDQGEPLVVATYIGKCNHVEKSKTVRIGDGQYKKLAGSLTIRGDIAPGTATLAGVEGSVIIGGTTWEIFTAHRPKNPDGSVNHTKLELI